MLACACASFFYLNSQNLKIIVVGGVISMKIGSLGIRLVVHIHIPKLPHVVHKIPTTNKRTVSTQSNAGCEFKGICLKWLLTSSYLD